MDNSKKITDNHQFPIPNSPCPMPNPQSTFLQEYPMPLTSVFERDNQ
ncbi:hypothetical protein [Nostoc sp.]